MDITFSDDKVVCNKDSEEWTEEDAVAAEERKE